MFASWRTKVKKVERLIAAGKLTEAAHEAIIGNLAKMRAGRGAVNRLTEALTNQAQRFSSMADFSGAWENMSWASQVALAEAQDQISKEKTRLVDQTVEHAQQLLEIGKPAQANRVATLLSSRHILDRRADEVRKVCRAMRLVDQLTAEGKLSQAATMLDDIHHHHSHLSFLASRARSIRKQREELSGLHGQLAKAMNSASWDQVRNISNRMLQISPNYQIAIDAIRRSKSTTPDNSRNRTVPDRVAVLESSPGYSPLVDPIVDPEVIDPIDAETFEASDGSSQVQDDILFIGDEPAQVTDTHSFNSQETEVPQTTKAHKNSKLVPDAPEFELSSISDIQTQKLKPFMMWVDGVGGFWVYLNDQITIGQDSLESKVDLPIQGDLGRNRIRLDRSGDSYVISPTERTEDGLLVDGVVLEDDMLLGETHEIGIAKARLRFRQPHAWSNSACLSLETRHRTIPWSDGVLLLGSTLILGPEPSCHVVCPHWNTQLVFFQRDGKLFCNCKVPIEVDGHIVEGQASLTENSRIAGEDFAITLEPLENI